MDITNSLYHSPIYLSFPGILDRPKPGKVLTYARDNNQILEGLSTEISASDNVASGGDSLSSEGQATSASIRTGKLEKHLSRKLKAHTAE